MPEGTQKLILIADDSQEVIEYYEKWLHEDGFVTISATTLQQLDEVFDASFDKIDAVVLDGCIPGDELNTLGFIERALTNGFTQPIIAASSVADYRKMMVKAGCSAESEKKEVPDVIWDLFNLASA